MTQKIQNGVVVNSDGTFEEDAELVTLPTSPVEFTQTYSTAATTVPAATYAAPTVTAGAHTFPGSGNLFDAVAADLLINLRVDSTANLGADVATNVKGLAVNVNQAIVDTASTNTQVAALAADVLALKKVITSLIDLLQAARLAA